MIEKAVAAVETSPSSKLPLEEEEMPVGVAFGSSREREMRKDEREEEVKKNFVPVEELRGGVQRLINRPPDLLAVRENGEIVRKGHNLHRREVVTVGAPWASEENILRNIFVPKPCHRRRAAGG
ncbi:hypothetical protein HPP92_023426 [Vanilla planifolia]|uniref:Uncharacterized protein n=1 Tax=Vanilla planifolia TaxID=51239 RepID=A0A835PRG4_VANPL|nr:hypothetical protein HPP92_023426 [Vanilla planifolia]